MNCQAENDVLERYVTVGLSEEELGPFVEHLLVCEACRKEVVEMEAYVEAMRSAAQELRRCERPRSAWLPQLLLHWQPLSAAAAMVILALLVAGPWHSAKTGGLAPAAIMLQASRGAEGPLVPAGSPLALGMDLAELPAFATYRVEVVNQVGTKMAEIEARPTAGKLQAVISAGLRSGIYFVRLYSSSCCGSTRSALEIKKSDFSTSR